MRRTGVRCTRSNIEWIPRQCTRPRGRPPTRWAECSLKENPDEDFDFDPDCFAIYRRSVEFLLPVEEKMMSIIKKLQGTDGKLTRERMWYQTCSTSSLPGIRSEFVYAVGDLHSVLI
ncbi:hypothetical protein KIN20_012756 [Parelaphostrongylus tenuis]|uniref:Uncharacterized protein n=1 Tax=Parelaphostrongylus tenuis TaxID=148309 RepID=A0AAD5QNC4_PARTN|nr:hypothetical protein KIN20_012756 [Parelaphostrongylus tenuis]